jgi:Glycyl-tRNA synthetase (class II)
MAAQNLETQESLSMEKIVSLAKRRGFVFQSSEIYGGQAGAWDYGPMGIELKNRIARFWWKEMTQLHDDIVGLDAAILMHPRVWEASGHVENFTDPLVDCKKCKTRFRADQIDQDKLARKECPDCGGELTDTRKFNLMFKHQHRSPRTTGPGSYTCPPKPPRASTSTTRTSSNPTE